MTCSLLYFLSLLPVLIQTGVKSRCVHRHEGQPGLPTNDQCQSGKRVCLAAVFVGGFLEVPERKNWIYRRLWDELQVVWISKQEQQQLYNTTCAFSRVLLLMNLQRHTHTKCTKERQKAMRKKKVSIFPFMSSLASTLFLISAAVFPPIPGFIWQPCYNKHDHVTPRKIKRRRRWSRATTSKMCN